MVSADSLSEFQEIHENMKRQYESLYSLTAASCAFLHFASLLTLILILAYTGDFVSSLG